MRESSLWLIGGGAIAALALGAGSARAAARLPVAAPPDADPPLYIADDVEALARVMISEAGTQAHGERVAIAWVCRNRAAKRGVSIAKMVCNPCGRSTGKRPFSSRLAPRTADRELAALILATPQAEDPTHGATSCFEPDLQDRLVAAGRKGYVYDARTIRYCWTRSMDYYGTVGRWDLFGPRGGVGARSIPSEWRLDGYVPPIPCPDKLRRPRRKEVA